RTLRRRSRRPEPKLGRRTRRRDKGEGRRGKTSSRGSAPAFELFTSRKVPTMEREQAAKFLHDLLKLMLSRNGSDLFLTADFPPAFKIDGRVQPVSNTPLSPQHTVELARALMNDKQAAEFEAHKEVNFAISPAGIGRFRVNAFMQQNRVGIVLRTINTEIPTFEQLQLPLLLRELALTKRGMIIVVGATGSGKSNTLAALIGHRNENSHGHIVTIEDPVEFVHPHR